MRFDDFELKQHVSGGGIALGDGCMLVEDVNGKRTYSAANSSGVWRSLYVDVPDTAIEAAAAAMGMVWPDTTPTPPDPVDPPVVPPTPPVTGWDEYSPAVQQLAAAQPDMVPLAGPQFAPVYQPANGVTVVNVSGDFSAHLPLQNNTCYNCDDTAYFNVTRAHRDMFRGLSDVTITGLYFHHAHFGSDSIKDDETPHFELWGARNIVISDCTMNGATWVDGYGTTHFWRLRDVDGFRLLGTSMVNGGYKTITMTEGVKNVEIGYCDISRSRIDAITLAGTDGVNIHHNIIHRWAREPLDIRHSDAVQSMVVQTSAAAQLNNVTIAHNIIDIEDGPQTQSFFNRNEKGIANSHTNWTIEGNLIVNSQKHGITVAGNDTTVRNNVLIRHANTSEPYNVAKYANFPGGYDHDTFQPQINGNTKVSQGNRVFASLADALADSNHYYRD